MKNYRKFNEEGNILKGEEDLVKMEENDMIKKTINMNLSCLFPHEVGKDDIREDDNGNAINKPKKNENSKKEENDLGDDCFGYIILGIGIYMTILPYNKNNEIEDFQIVITYKTFETLYSIN